MTAKTKTKIAKTAFKVATAVATILSVLFIISLFAMAATIRSADAQSAEDVRELRQIVQATRDRQGEQAGEIARINASLKALEEAKLPERMLTHEIYFNLIFRSLKWLIVTTAIPVLGWIGRIAKYLLVRYAKIQKGMETTNEV